MKQTSIEGTEPRTKRPASELAIESEMKANRYRRKALLAESAALSKLNLALIHAMEIAGADDTLKRVREHAFDAHMAFEAELERRIREQG